MKTAYPGYLKKGFQPYDPIELMPYIAPNTWRAHTVRLAPSRNTARPTARSTTTILAPTGIGRETRET